MFLPSHFSARLHYALFGLCPTMKLQQKWKLGTLVIILSNAMHVLYHYHKWWKGSNATLNAMSISSRNADFDFGVCVCMRGWAVHFILAQMEFDTGPKATNLEVFYLFITFIASNYPALQTFVHEVDAFVVGAVVFLTYNYPKVPWRKRAGRP